MDKSDTQIFEGVSGKHYKSTIFFKHTTDKDFVEPFVEINCICIAITRFNTKDLISCLVEFQEELTEETYKGKLDINGFRPYGIAVIKSTKSESDAIIKDLKGNKKFYFENSSDLI